MSTSPLLSCMDIRKTFRTRSPVAGTSLLTAVDGVTLSLLAGETLGLAGESGCGKSTLAKICAGLLSPDSGSVSYRGAELQRLKGEEQRRFRRATQMIFQDPFSSLNPRIRIGDTIAEPLIISGVERTTIRERVNVLLDSVGLKPEHGNRFPDEFSGGQRQRIGLARALAGSPEILIADEPVSSLDISIQAQIINLLMEMKNAHGLTMLIVSHDLSVLRHICNRIAVMYLGAIVESAPAGELFSNTLHPYTEALISSVPCIERKERTAPSILTGDPPSPLSIPSGCRFHPRCPAALDKCHNESPTLTEISPGHFSACHLNKSSIQE